MTERVRNWLRNHAPDKKRSLLYAGLLLMLGAATAASVWTASRAGAYLTDEGDWQNLAGDYRIGIIDYTVDVNGQLLIVQGTDTDAVMTYQMIVPQLAGVRIFDSTVDAGVREQEFNEGVTLMRVRVINRSESMVSVDAAFQLVQDSGPEATRVLPLPEELSLDAAENLNYRQYVLDQLKLTDSAAMTEAESLTALKESYERLPAQMELSIGVLEGASATPPPGDWVQEGSRYYSYKDVFLILWSEYGTGEYNAALQPDGAAANARWGRFHAVFTVGQTD